ncbi:YkyA family protein [Pallidibacillus thermolactis]|uniref:YkyA family protein n=1 Tax=Pallidibacillus thermolactis TaxID=251051 RepID=UPI0021D9CBDC|nr:YkyA family protein [Pallidibacillus thermolactis]MCU9600410.1 YkyA family protein [Pallidibacillus thermolactis subsp. kokeshiiformis]
MKKKRVFIIGLLSIMTILFLSGCSQPEEEKIYETLEAVVQLEKGFEKQQEPLVQLEEEEKAIYEKILNLGLKEIEEIQKLSDDAIALSEQRQGLIDLERESIVKAEKEFEKIKEKMNNIDEEGLKKLASELYVVMKDRYESHAKLYEQYSLGIKQDQELYHMLKDENVSLEELKDKVDKINKVYEEVYSLNERFNDLTQQYNDLKIKFYKESGLN